MPTKKIRSWILLDKKTYKEMQEYAQQAGVPVPSFLRLSAVMGSRMLARIASPEKFLTPEMLEAAMRLEKEDTNK